MDVIMSVHVEKVKPSGPLFVFKMMRHYFNYFSSFLSVSH